MNDTILRVILAVIAGFTYMAGAIPDSVTFAQLSSLPVATWLLFVVNFLTAFASPSLLKKAVGGKP